MHFTPFFTIPKNKKLLFKITSSSRRGGEKRKRKNEIKTYPVAHKKNIFRTITHPNNLDAASLNAGVGIKLSSDRLESLGTHGNYERRPSTGRDAFFCILLFHEAKLIAVPLDFSPISFSLSGREPVCALSKTLDSGRVNPTTREQRDRWLAYLYTCACVRACTSV